MLRSVKVVLAAAFAALVVSAPDTEAANRDGQRGVGQTIHRQGRVAVPRPDARRMARPGFDRTGSGRHFDRHAGYRRGHSGGFWPGYGVPVPPFSVGAQQLRETEPAIERDAFAGLPVVVGIAREPTPVPTLYTIAGPRDRPVTRAFRLNEAEPRGRPRSRFVHAETGALLLSMPQR